MACKDRSSASRRTVVRVRWRGKEVSESAAKKARLYNLIDYPGGASSMEPYNISSVYLEPDCPFLFHRTAYPISDSASV